jgi:hypothetical protein
MRADGSLPAARTMRSTLASACTRSTLLCASLLFPLCFRGHESDRRGFALLPFRASGPRPPLQNGFGDVAYIGWVPLDLYRASGALMRSEKEVHRHWPVPQQPEQDELVGIEQDAVARILPVQEAAQAGKDRFRIQW